MSKTPSEQIIEIFGGIRPMAQKMEISHTTVQGWAKRRIIPWQRFEAIETIALQYNLAGKVVPLLNHLRQESVEGGNSGSTSFINHNQTSQSAQNSQQETSTSSEHYAFGHKNENTNNMDQDFIPRPLPEYTFVPQKKSAMAGSFFVSVVSIALTFGIIAVLFFAPDILPKRQNDSTMEDYYIQQNQEMTQTLNQYKETIDTMADRVYVLAKTTQDMQSELQALRAEKNNMVAAMSDEHASRLNEIEGQLQSLEQANNQIRSLVEQAEMSYGVDENSALADIRSMVDSVNNELSSMKSSLEVENDANAQATNTETEIITDTVVDSQAVILDEQNMASIVQSTGGIANAIKNGGSFGKELEVLSIVMGHQNPELAQTITKLKPFAQSGVPQSSEIASLLDTLSGDILAASPEYRNSSITDKAKMELGKMISIRKEGELPQGEDSAAILRRAKLYLEANQIQAAQKELAKLSPEAAQVATPVMEQMAVTEIAHQFIGQLEGVLNQYIPAEYMNGIVRPWLDATRDAAQLKFQDPRTIKAPKVDFKKYNLNNLN